MLPLVGFSGPPPEPGVPVTEHRALHKSLRAERMSSCRGGPWRGDGCAPVSVARDAHPAGIEQLPGRRGRPPSAAAVASAEFLPGHSAVLASDPLRHLIPRDLAQVLKGRARHPRPEVGARAAQHRVEPVQQSWQWPVDVCSAQHLDLGRDRLEGFLGGVGVDVMPCGASFAVPLDTPPQEIEARLDVRRQAPHLPVERESRSAQRRPDPHRQDRARRLPLLRGARKFITTAREKLTSLDSELQ
jgi:hypothetical protein